ncbi:MAG: Ig-like domain-containing protein [Gemmatimonadales bacterium]
MLGGRVLIASLIGLIVLGEAGCSNPGGPANPDPSTGNVPVLGVKVTPQSIQLAIGETQQLSATVRPADATDQAVAWESTDPTVATVDSVGRVTAVAVGAGIIVTAYTHDGQHQSSANLTVNP